MARTSADAVTLTEQVNEIAERLGTLYGLPTKTLWLLGVEYGLFSDELLSLKHTDIRDEHMYIGEHVFKPTKRLRALLKEIESNSSGCEYVFSSTYSRECRPYCRKTMSGRLSKVGKEFSLSLGFSSR
jgi:integrase